MMKFILRSALALVLIIGILMIFLLSSTGLKVGLWLGKSFLPGELKYRSVSGLIIGPIDFKNLEYRTSQFSFEAKEIKFNWNLWALFIRRLSIEELDIKQARIVSLQKTTASHLNLDSFYQKNPFIAYTRQINQVAQAYKSFLQNFKLSWSISVRKAKIGPLSYFSEENKNRFELSQLQLQGLLTSHKTSFLVSGAVVLPFVSKFELNLLGKPEHYRLYFNTQGKNLNFSIEGSGNPTEIQLITSKNSVFRGHLNAKLKLNWEKDLIWDAQISAEHVNFSSLYPEWSHDFKGNIQSQGNLSDENPEFSLQSEIKTQNAHIALNIQHKHQWDAHWLISLAKGQYQTQGQLNGSFENPITTGNLVIQNFSYQQFSASGLKIQWKLPLVQSAPSDIQVSANNLSTPSFYADHSRIHWKGTLRNHKIEIQSDLNQASTLLSLEGRFENRTWSAQLTRWSWGEFNLPKKDSINLKIALPNYQSGFPKLTDKIQASLEANLSKLSFIQDLLPSLRVSGGEISGNLQLNGSLTKPILSGDLNLIRAKISIPDLNLKLQDASIRTEAVGSLIHYTAHAIAGKQPVTIMGETNLLSEGFTTHLKVIGKDILLVDTPEYTIYGSPDISVNFVGRQLNLSGNIFVPKGLIRPHDFRNITQLPTNEVSFIGKPKVVGESFWQINMDLNLLIGDNLIVDSFGIQGLVTGSLHLIQSPDQTLLANGKIGIQKGLYRAYGHQLKISHGSFMQFTNSPINNPILNIQATRKVRANTGTNIQSFASENITVGMNIHGPISNPEIDLFSSSGNLSQSDILSYILTGSTSGGSGSYGSARNFNAGGNFSYTANILDAVKLGGAGVSASSDGLISKIQSGLGFSEFGFENDTTTDLLGNSLGNQTNFVVGRRLSKNLYLRYTRGIFGPGLQQENKITLRYLFKRHWAIQLETSEFGNGTGTGGDVLYTTERK